MRDLPIQPMFSRKQWKWLPALQVPAQMLQNRDERAKINHGGQDINRLATRGGCSPCEALAIIDDRKWALMDDDQAYEELSKRILTFKGTLNKEPATVQHSNLQPL